MRTIGCGVWSRVALLLTRGGATSIYTVGRTEKKQQKNARGNAKKKKKEKTTSRERDIHTLTLSAFSFCFSNITSTRKHTRARLPLPPKPKPKKQTSDVAALNENLRKERTYTQIYLAFILRRFLVNIFFVNYRLDIFILSKREKPVFQLKKKENCYVYRTLHKLSRSTFTESLLPSSSVFSSF